MKHFLYTRSSRVFVIAETDLPKDICECGQKNCKGAESLSAALSTKGVKVTNAIVTETLKMMVVTNKTSVILLKGKDEQDWTRVVENQLYDIPAGFQVKIEEGHHTIIRATHGHIKKGYYKYATILPIEPKFMTVDRRSATDVKVYVNGREVTSVNTKLHLKEFIDRICNGQSNANGEEQPIYYVTHSDSSGLHPDAKSIQEYEVAVGKILEEIREPSKEVKEESQDELWDEVSSYYNKLNALTVNTMPHPKSKFTITRRA